MQTPLSTAFCMHLAIQWHFRGTHVLTKVKTRVPTKIERVIIEAVLIASARDKCLITPSVLFTDKKLSFFRSILILVRF